jgi:lipopolysaccharide/colanic/teichoic acid biosynthesis glycosyltransferase
MPRWFELIFVGSALVVLLVPMVMVALVVSLSLGHPILLGQERVGRFGKTFLIRKFRSMTDDRGPDGKLLPDAQRVTKVTAFLRRTRLDELPQLLSIISGDMALVGPRPLFSDSIARFGAWGQRRCEVRPGLTGWAQVSGNSVLSEPDKLALDVWYVAHRSFALDLQILAQSLLVVLFGEKVNHARIAQAKGWLAETRLVPATDLTARA